MLIGDSFASQSNVVRVIYQEMSLAANYAGAYDIRHFSWPGNVETWRTFQVFWRNFFFQSKYAGMLVTLSKRSTVCCQSSMLVLASDMCFGWEMNRFDKSRVKLTNGGNKL